MDSFEQAPDHTGVDAAFPTQRQDEVGAEFAAESAGQHRQWRVNCRDVENAHRFLNVLVNRDKVVLAGPPGRNAVLSAGGAGQLSAALRLAADQARK